VLRSRGLTGSNLTGLVLIVTGGLTGACLIGACLTGERGLKIGSLNRSISVAGGVFGSISTTGSVIIGSFITGLKIIGSVSTGTEGLKIGSLKRSGLSKSVLSSSASAVKEISWSKSSNNARVLAIFPCKGN